MKDCDQVIAYLKRAMDPENIDETEWAMNLDKIQAACEMPIDGIRRFNGNGKSATKLIDGEMNDSNHSVVPLPQAPDTSTV